MVVADARGLTLSTWVGTADAGASDNSPNDGLTSPDSDNNMLEVSSDQYDGGSDGGDGNLTESKAYVDATPDDARETLYGSDWRDRPLWTMVNDGTVGTPGRYTFTFNTYDNLDEVTDVTRYWDKLGTTPPDTRPDPSDTGFSTYYAIIGRSGAAYDNLGQQYQTIAYNEPGTIAIISNMWYDADGNEIMSLPGGTQEFQKSVYDGLDEPTVVYTGYDPSNTAVTYAAAGSVSGDVILTQTDTTYDLAGDDVFDASYNRLPGDETTRHRLLAPPPEGGTPAPSQITYTAAWFDGIGRDVANVNYGASAGVPPLGGAAPTSIDTTGATQVSFTQYNARGEDAFDTDNAGRITENIDDDAGRPVETIQNYAVDDSGQPVDEADENLISASTFHVTEQIAADATLSPYTGDSIAVGDATFDFHSQTNLGTGDYAVPGGVAYVMYDASTTAFALVRYDNSGWTAWNASTEEWISITATASDVLVAAVEFIGSGGATVTDLAGSGGIFEGVQRGYRSGDLTFSSGFGTTGPDSDGTYHETVSIEVAASGFVPYFAASDNTLYVYGTGIGDDTPDLFSNDLLRAVIYADSTNTWDSVVDDAGGNMVEYTYDRQAETLTTTDQNGTTHAYAYDGIGHELTDSITVPSGNPANIDLTVTELAFAYKVCGRFLSATSLDADGDVVNEVLDHYDTNGDLDKVYQEHNDAVDTSTSEYVAYGYDDSTSTGYDGALGTTVTIAAAGFRPTTLQYPTTGTDDSRVITDSYGTSGGMNDEINQLDSIIDGTGTAADPTTGDTIDTVAHLGDGTLTAETYTLPSTTIGYNLLGTTTTGGVTTPNMDQFNRVQNMFWKNYAGTTLDGFEYLRNSQGDVTERTNAVDAVMSEMYANDKLDQVESLTRGTVSDGAIATPTFTENFSPDGFGNQSSYDQTVDGSTTIDQTRTAGPTNEIAAVSSSVGDMAAPSYDAAGNSIITPSAVDPSVGLRVQVDGWNHVTARLGTGASAAPRLDGRRFLFLQRPRLHGCAHGQSGGDGRGRQDLLLLHRAADAGVGPSQAGFAGRRRNGGDVSVRFLATVRRRTDPRHANGCDL